MDKGAHYELLCAQLTSMLAGERHPLAGLANASALLFEQLEELNWAGFYLCHQGALLLGPFQGKPACVHIALGRGVCGTAAREDATQRVEDVHAFPGHIACDAGSRSEIVVPLHWAGRVIGVMDLDSPRLARFDAADQRGLEALARRIEEGLDWQACGYQLDAGEREA